jgi:Na+/proline symporter
VLHAGAVLVIVMIFMAVTSSGASEMLAVSSLFTFDIYRRYIKPKVRTNATCLLRSGAIDMTSYC